MDGLLRSGRNEDHLAEMLVLAHALVGGGRLLEREGAIDRETDPPRGYRVPEIGPNGRDDLTHLLDAARAEGDPDVLDALPGVEVEVKIALHPAKAADV